MQPFVLVPQDGYAMLLARDSESYQRLTPQGYDTLAALDPDTPMPAPVVNLLKQRFSFVADGMSFGDVVLVRKPSSFGYQFASWELNLLCNYNCAHCYLGERPNQSVGMADRIKILDTMVELGVFQLQITGGEPLIDRHFEQTYLEAYRRGILLTVSTNGSWLWKPSILKVITGYPPLRLTISLYGATAESYESLTRTPAGTFNRFIAGMEAIARAGITLRINCIVTTHNEHEADAMRELAVSFAGAENVFTYGSMSPTIHGGADPLQYQASSGVDKTSTNFGGCGAGVKSFHVDPMGRTSMCKLGRQYGIQLHETGARGLSTLALNASMRLSTTRSGGGCSDGCSSGGCGICPVIADNNRAAGKSFSCRPKEGEEVMSA